MFRPATRLVLAALSAMLALTGVAAAQENGLHDEPWFAATFLDLNEDLADATAQGKDLMLIVEQTGCVYCKKMHDVNFSRKDIPAYIQQHFMVVQLDLNGTREVTDFDGQALPEQVLMQKWGVRYTPTTLMFAMPEGAKPPVSLEDSLALVLPGYLKPEMHLATMRFVAEDGYLSGQKFPQWLASHRAPVGN